MSKKLRESIKLCIHDAFGSYVENIQLSSKDYKKELNFLSAGILHLIAEEVRGMWTIEPPKDTFIRTESWQYHDGYVDGAEAQHKAIADRLEEEAGG